MRQHHGTTWALFSSAKSRHNVAKMEFYLIVMSNWNFLSEIYFLRITRKKIFLFFNFNISRLIMSWIHLKLTSRWYHPKTISMAFLNRKCRSIRILFIWMIICPVVCNIVRSYVRKRTCFFYQPCFILGILLWNGSTI